MLKHCEILGKSIYTKENSTFISNFRVEKAFFNVDSYLKAFLKHMCRIQNIFYTSLK